MKLTILIKAYKFIRPRLIGVSLVSLVYCVPIYLLVWYFDLIDDLSARILISVLVAIMPVAEFLSGPRPWKSRGELLWFALFIVPVCLFATSHKFDLRVLFSNTAMLVAVIPWCWLVWLLMGRSLLLLSGLTIAFAAMLIYWAVALSEVGGPPEILLLPLPTVLFVGVFWAPAARLTLYFARQWKDRPMCGPGMQALAMAILFFPVILVAVVVPWMLELKPIWSAVSLTIVGVLLSAVISEPLRRFLLVWGKLLPNPTGCPEQRQNTSG